jgi:hypothetical protein
MVNINYDGDTYHIKSDVNELTIGEYEIINSFLMNDDTYFDKWFNVLCYLGLPERVLDDIDSLELIDIIKSFNLSEVVNSYINEIEIDGYKYVCELKNGLPKISGKDMRYIETYCVGDKYIAAIMAILFKRVDLVKEHYNEEHIDWKIKLFKDLEASISVPYIYYIAHTHIKNLKVLNDSKEMLG